MTSSVLQTSLSEKSVKIDYEFAAEFYRNWMSQKNFTSRTQQGRLHNLSIFLKWLERNEVFDLAQVQPEHLLAYAYERQRYINKKYGKQNTVYTRTKEILVLQQLFDQLHIQGKLPANPSTNLEAPNRNRTQLPKSILTHPQVKKLLQLPDLVSPIGRRDKVILELLYGTGIRRMELCNLRVSDLDFKNGSIVILNGKFQKDRVVPMSDELAACLKKYLTKTHPILLKTKPLSVNRFTCNVASLAPAVGSFPAPFEGSVPTPSVPPSSLAQPDSAPQTPGGSVGGATPSSQEESLRWDTESQYPDFEDRLFIQPGGYPVSERNLNRILRPYFNKLGISGSTHLIRHTVATHLIQAGMPLRYVQELLGHESLQSTLVYVHLAIKDLQKEYKRTHPRERL